MMAKFRICENRYGWCKIQLWYPPFKILFITIKGEWKDSCFRLNRRRCGRFETLDAAEKVMQSMIENNQMMNNEWDKCTKD